VMAEEPTRNISKSLIMLSAPMSTSCWSSRERVCGRARIPHQIGRFGSPPRPWHPG
jgi:hypothetical protein